MGKPIMSVHYNGPESTHPGRIACAPSAETEHGQVVTQDWARVECNWCKLERSLEQTPNEKARDAYWTKGCGADGTERDERVLTPADEPAEDNGDEPRFVLEVMVPAGSGPYMAIVDTHLAGDNVVATFHGQDRLTKALPVLAGMNARADELGAAQERLAGAERALTAAWENYRRARDAEASLRGRIWPQTAGHAVPVGRDTPGTPQAFLGHLRTFAERQHRDAALAVMPEWPPLAGDQRTNTPVEVVDYQSRTDRVVGMTKLSTAAQDALINTDARQGATPVGAPDSVLVELQDARLIGPDTGLTRKGLIKREQVFAARLDAAF